MGLTRKQQREIMERDERARIDRLIAEYVALAGKGFNPPPGSMFIRADARAMGAVTALDCRVSPRWKQSHPRAIGRATRSDDNSQGPTVRVIHADGTEEIRTVASYRKGKQGTSRARRASAPSAPKQTDVERFGLTNNIGQDYS
jgi:hypothetical protein